MSSYLLKCLLLIIIIAYMCNTHKSLSVLLISFNNQFSCFIYFSHFLLLSRFKSYHLIYGRFKNKVYFVRLQCELSKQDRNENEKKSDSSHSRIVICSSVVTSEKIKIHSSIDNEMNI